MYILFIDPLAPLYPMLLTMEPFWTICFVCSDWTPRLKNVLDWRVCTKRRNLPA